MGSYLSGIAPLMASVSAAVMVFLGWWTIQNVGNNFLDSTLFSCAAIFCCLACFSLGASGIDRRALVLCFVFAVWMLATNALLQKVGNNFLDSTLLSWAVIFCCLASLSVGTLQFHRRTFIFCLVLAGWILVADLVSSEPLPAIARDVQWFLLPLLVFFYGRMADANPDFLKTLRVAIALSLIWICLDLFLSADDVYNWIYVPVFGNVRRLGMSVGIMTVFLYFDSDMQGNEKKLIVTARVVGLAMLFWAGGRGSFLGWFLAFCIFVFANRNRRKATVRYLLEIAVAIFFASVFATDVEAMGLWSGLVRPAAFHDATLDQISSLRFSLWERTASAFNDPYCIPFGAGGNGFVRLKLMATNQIFHPHNILFQAASDWGVIGLLLLILLGAVVLRRLASIRGAMGDKEVVGAGMLVFLGVVGMLDGGLYHFEYLIYLALALGILLGACNRLSTGNSVLAVPKRFLFLLLLCTVGLHIYLRDYRPAWVNTPLGKPVHTYGVCAGGIR